MKKIAVIGSINMDMTAEAERIPRPGETLIGRSLSYNPGGKGANQAVAAAKLGGDVTMFGCVGDDSFGGRLLENLSRCGVHTEHIARVAGVSSGLAMITVGESDNTIVVIPGANHCVTPEYLRSREEEILKADVFLLQNEIPMESVLFSLRLAHRAGKLVIYNPAPAADIPREALELAGCLTPNQHEAALLFPGRESLEALLREQPGKLVVTLGSDGVKTALPGGEILHVPSCKVEVVDTTGAGDTFNGALAFALADGQELSDALRFANTAAGLSTRALGAQAGMPDRRQVEEACSAP